MGAGVSMNTVANIVDTTRVRTMRTRLMTQDATNRRSNQIKMVVPMNVTGVTSYLIRSDDDAVGLRVVWRLDVCVELLAGLA